VQKRRLWSFGQLKTKGRERGGELPNFSPKKSVTVNSITLERLVDKPYGVHILEEGREVNPDVPGGSTTPSSGPKIKKLKITCYFLF